jgi:hypothetical protein
MATERLINKMGTSKNSVFNGSYESVTTVGVVRPQPVTLLQKRRIHRVFRDAQITVLFTTKSGVMV